MTYVPSNDGRWVSERFMNLAEIIQDYDPQFELRWIPPEKRSDPTDHSRAFCVYDTINNVPCMYAGEDAEPSEVLAHLFLIDNEKHNVLEEMEARNAAVEAIRLKEECELAEQRQEYITWLMASRRNYYNLRDRRGDLHLYDDQYRKIR